MKNVIAVILSVFSLALFAQSKNTSVMAFEGDALTYDFGDIVANKPVEHVFRFTNKGDTPIIINNVSSSCGCTVPEIPKEPVLPGKTGEIKVTFNGAGANHFQKSIVLTTNLPDPRVTLYITGEILSEEQYKEKHK